MVSMSSRIAKSLWVAVLATSLLAFGAAGCDKSKSEEEDEAKAESPEEPSGEKTDASGSDRQEMQAKKKIKKKIKKQGALRKKMKKGEKIEVSDKDLENFARVQIRMKDFAESEGMDEKKPQGKKQKIQMMMKMKKKAESVMKDIGMDKNRYTKVGRRMKADPELQKRLDKKVKELQSEEGGAASGGGESSGAEADGG